MICWEPFCLAILLPGSIRTGKSQNEASAPADIRRNIAMKSKSKNRFHLFIAVGAILSLWTMGCQPQEQSQNRPPQRTPVVSVVTVTTQPVTLTTELPGRTSAYRIAEIRPQVNGLIQKRLFTEGSEVKAGDVLYQIDPAPYEAALKNAEAGQVRSEANLPAMQSKVERYEKLLAESIVSQQIYDDAVAALNQAHADVQYWKATVQTAQINLAYTRITAPISGRIGRSNVTEGAIVTAYQPTPLATIQQLDPIYVDVLQPTTQLLRMKRWLESGRLDQKSQNRKSVKLTLEDGSPYPLAGTLQFQDVSVDSTTGSVNLRVVFPNPARLLLPGMFVRALINEGTDEKATTIPQQTLLRDPKGNPMTLVVDGENIVQQRMLTLDRAIGDQWVVGSGLSEGERIIAEGSQQVKQGDTVKTVPFEASTAGDKNTASTNAGQAE